MNMVVSSQMDLYQIYINNLKVDLKYNSCLFRPNLIKNQASTCLVPLIFLNIAAVSSNS